MLLSVHEEIKQRAFNTYPLKECAVNQASTGLSDYKHLIYAMAQYFGLKETHFIRDGLFGLKIDNRYQIHYAYQHDCNSLLITSYLPITLQSDRLALYEKFLKANVNSFQEYQFNIGMLDHEGQQYIVLRTTLAVNSLNTGHLVSVSEQLIQSTNGWVYDC